MTIKAVIWDMGGVILRMKDEKPRQELAREFNLPLEKIYAVIFDGPSAQQAAIGRLTTREHWLSVGRALNLTEHQLLDFLTRFWSVDEIDYDLVDYIKNLRQNFRTALLSNAWDNLRELIQDTWHVDAAFDQIIISAEVGFAKPDPCIYQLALERLGIQAEEAIFIDDVLENVRAAQQVGLHAIQFKERQQVYTELDGILA